MDTTQQIGIKVSGALSGMVFVESLDAPVSALRQEVARLLGTFCNTREATAHTPTSLRAAYSCRLQPVGIERHLATQSTQSTTQPQGGYARV